MCSYCRPCPATALIRGLHYAPDISVCLTNFTSRFFCSRRVALSLSSVSGFQCGDFESTSCFFHQSKRYSALASCCFNEINLRPVRNMPPSPNYEGDFKRCSWTYLLSSGRCCRQLKIILLATDRSLHDCSTENSNPFRASERSDIGQAPRDSRRSQIKSPMNLPTIVLLHYLSCQMNAD